MANEISALRALDAAVAPFHVKVNEVANWYDIVMQSFEERYNRSMKTWAIVIAFLVVAMLNADLFTIYRTIAANGVISKALGDMGPDIVKLTKERKATEQTPLEPAEQPVTGLENRVNALKDDVGGYLDFGFTPLGLQQLKDWLGTLRPGNPAWWLDRKKDLRSLLGWIVMTMLLSIGAPFWEDILESLFGVKNLIRKKAAIKSVEAASGTGQPTT